MEYVLKYCENFLACDMRYIHITVANESGIADIKKAQLKFSMSQS